MSAHMKRDGISMSSDVYARHFDGVTDMAIARARDGVNRSCVECGEAPLDGGLRCLECFGRVAQQSRFRGVVDSACGTPAGHARHGRRGEKPCRACLDANAARVREIYHRKKAAA